MPVESSVERVSVLGLPVDRVTLTQAETLLKQYLESEGTKLVFTADSHAFICAETDPAFRRCFSEAALITPDSAGPAWALGQYGKPVPGRVSGVDLVEVLCKISATTGATIYFLGGAPGVAEAAAANLSLKHPGCNIVGSRDGFFGDLSDEDVAESIAKLKPDILVVAMGMPRQELFILDTAKTICAKIGIGVGGSLDVHSGMVKRAPMIFQKLRVEWLWRLLLNPRKLEKVKNLPKFYLSVRRAQK
ncbi:MAG: WecB/TagA/CpsF family glycosyltransferase [Fimbriimonas sp.]|nr:WecB/TagA/CpsF family glycosyltransferase [Fimbriimonas sp.]